MMRDLLSDAGRAAAQPDTVGKMKQFATYFTHGVRNGSKLRAEIYRAHGISRILDRWMRFFERESAEPRRLKQVQLITDGACIGNPGPGGWACILRFGDYEARNLRLRARAPRTIAWRWQAAIEGLSALKETCEVEIVTDSEYVKNGITEWIQGWKRNGWRRADKKPVANQDLWMMLDELATRAIRPRGPGPRGTLRTTTTIAATSWPAARRKSRFQARPPHRRFTISSCPSESASSVEPSIPFIRLTCGSRSRPGSAARWIEFYLFRPPIRRTRTPPV